MIEMQKSFASMKNYMKQMDEELADTAVAKTFPLKKPTTVGGEIREKVCV